MNIKQNIKLDHLSREVELCIFETISQGFSNTISKLQMQFIC